MIGRATLTVAQLERAQRENRRALRQLERRVIRGKASTATWNAIDRRRAADLDYQRRLAVAEVDGRG